MNDPALKSAVVAITGGSRGIGEAIAVRLGREGARVALLGKTVDPHPKLPGTLHTAAQKVIEAGGEAFPVQVDIRNAEAITNAFAAINDHFGKIDILINNASAIHLSGTGDTPVKRFDLMHQVNVRGTFLCTQAALPYLRKSQHAHVLNLSPPLNFEARWFKNHVAYSIAKFGMSLCVLGMAAEFESDGISVNALWPKTVIATAAVRNLLGGESTVRCARHPEIVADAAYEVLRHKPMVATGQYFIDEDVLRDAGTTDFSKYAVDPTQELLPDFFL